MILLTPVCAKVIFCLQSNLQTIKRGVVKAMKTKDLNFTQGYKELEKIVDDFESRDIDLEKDLPKFEKALELAQKLQKRLKQIENKIVEIDTKFSQEEDKDA